MSIFSKPTALQLAQHELQDAERGLLTAHAHQEIWASEVRRREQQIARLTAFVKERTPPAHEREESK